MFKRILAAVDDSTRMRLVMRASRALAERGGGALVVLRVCAGDDERNQVSDCDADLAEQTRALRSAGIAAHYLLHVGNPEKHIIETAQQQQSTLIVIATRQAGPVALPQRRMTARLAAHATVPVLALPEQGGAEQGDTQGADLFGPADAPLLVALDGSTVAERALPYAAELATLLDRPLVVIHVALPLLTQAEMAEAWAYVESARRRIRERISRDLRVDAQVVTGAPVDELLWAAEGRHAGAIVLTARGKTGYSSQRASPITMETLRKLTIPALLIPTPLLRADRSAATTRTDQPLSAEP